jgi:hypothetical protein
MAVWASSGSRAAPACARAMPPSLSKSRRFIKAADSEAAVEFPAWSHAEIRRGKSAESNNSRVGFVY